jgi:hypothetical protein
MQHYACALKIASEQRNTDFKPGISWLVAELFSETANRHQGTFAPEHASSFRRTAPMGARSFPNLPTRGGGGKRTLRYKTGNDTCVSVESQFRWMQDRTL